MNELKRAQDTYSKRLLLSGHIHAIHQNVPFFGSYSISNIFDIGHQARFFKNFEKRIFLILYRIKRVKYKKRHFDHLKLSGHPS